MRLRYRYRLVAAAAGLILAGCSARAQEAKLAVAGHPVHVVAIESVYGDLARQLGGERVQVTTVLNAASSDPHTYEPVAGDADAVAGADIVIENGLGYDAFADKLLAASPSAGRAVLNAGVLSGHRLGDNPHIWYEMGTLRRVNAAIARALNERVSGPRLNVAPRRQQIDDWISHMSARLARIGGKHGGAFVMITEPVFDYVLEAARLRIATPASFSHAIEEGSDPAPQDVDTMRELMQHGHIAAFVYNRQTVEPATTHLLDLATAAKISVVPVTETLPPNETIQSWIGGEVDTLERAL